MKEYKDMTREELIDTFLKELEDHRDSFLPSRYRWLSHGLMTLDKMRVYSGYLMAMRDCGKNIGDLKLILEHIIEKTTH